MAKIEACAWAAGLVAGVFIDCVTCHICVQNLMHTGMKMRVACSSLLYRKILNVPITFTENETSVGQVNARTYFMRLVSRSSNHDLYTIMCELKCRAPTLDDYAALRAIHRAFYGFNVCTIMAYMNTFWLRASLDIRVFTRNCSF
jgi:hypothetical protein